VYRPVHTRHFGKVDDYLTDKDGSRRLSTIFPPSFCSLESNGPLLLG
jgi:hypothetical protein